MEHFDWSLVNWSRGQFALTAMYHWLFVPLTLGLSFIIAFMESIYVRTGDPEWKKIVKFWMTLFGINFAIGVATGIILEFEFGTNWSNYSWFVGDIFGAPLAIEGIMAFFLESTFIAVMFFGWNKVSKRFHLASTWLVAFGANLSALWILVANAWMQSPVGMEFNPETARNEMVNFWQVLFSPMAVYKFLHTIASGFILASVFVCGISAWFLLKRREIEFAKKSIIVAAVFGIISSVYVVFTGDSSARVLGEAQPMKIAAIENLNHGKEGTDLIAFGILKDTKTDTMQYNAKDFLFKIQFPNLLSFLMHGKTNAFVPGINDLIQGNNKHGIISLTEKIDRGKKAQQLLSEIKNIDKTTDANSKYDSLVSQFKSKEFQETYFKYFGYSFLNDPKSLVPNIPLSFYSFHVMITLGFFFIALTLLLLIAIINDKIEKWRWLLYIALFSVPLPYIAGQAGWIVAEVGRQPWVIQDLLPTVAAASNIDAQSVMVTFILFAVLFTSLLIAEISIMLKQIKKGPKETGGN